MSNFFQCLSRTMDSAFQEPALNASAHGMPPPNCIAWKVYSAALALASGGLIGNNFFNSDAHYTKISLIPVQMPSITQVMLSSQYLVLIFRGEALASLADSAVLEVTSKARGAFETHTKLMKGSKVLKQGLAVEQRQRQGTIVTVRDFMFNKPVRRKQLILNG